MKFKPIAMTTCFLVLSTQCISSTRAASTSDSPSAYFYFGAHAAWNFLDVGRHYDEGFERDDMFLPGLQAGYRFSEDWSLNGSWERREDSTHLFGDHDAKTNIASATLRRHFGSTGFVPYLGFGAGMYRTDYIDAHNDAAYPETIAVLEAGLQRKISRRFLIDLGVRPYHSFRSERWDTTLYAGISYMVGVSKKEAPQAVTHHVTDTDGDGVPDPQDQCPNSAPGQAVDANGCELDDDGDGVVNGRDACPWTPAEALVDDQGCQLYLAKDIRETLYVEFGLDKSEVRRTSYPQLRHLAQTMREYPSARLILDGHTDSTGSAGYNDILSLQRANAVKDVFVQYFGVDPDRISTHASGESMPIADNDTSEGRAQNRRVEATIKASRREAIFGEPGSQ